jgi:hypothetical protein
MPSSLRKKLSGRMLQCHVSHLSARLAPTPRPCSGSSLSGVEGLTPCVPKSETRSSPSRLLTSSRPSRYPTCMQRSLTRCGLARWVFGASCWNARRSGRSSAFGPSRVSPRPELGTKAGSSDMLRPRAYRGELVAGTVAIRQDSRVSAERF